jgi:ABC-type multidrug transport system ATPase subunit
MRESAPLSRRVQENSIFASLQWSRTQIIAGLHLPTTGRVLIAAGANLDPEILLLDEIFAVGHAEFQRQCFATVEDFRRRGNTILFVSHTPSAIQSLCDRVYVLDQGRLQFDGSVADGLRFYEVLTGAAAPPASTVSG